MLTRRKSPWCKRPRERPIRRTSWRQLWGWGWGHRNRQPLSGSRWNCLPIHSSPHWCAEPRWRRATGRPDPRKSTTSRWDLNNSSNMFRPQHVAFISLCIAWGWLQMLPLWETGEVGRWEGRACNFRVKERGWETGLFWSVQWAFIKRKSVGWSSEHCC